VVFCVCVDGTQKGLEGNTTHDNDLCFGSSQPHLEQAQQDSKRETEEELAGTSELGGQGAFVGGVVCVAGLPPPALTPAVPVESSH
jgi:hypothetical protein